MATPPFAHRRCTVLYRRCTVVQTCTSPRAAEAACFFVAAAAGSEAECSPADTAPAAGASSNNARVWGLGPTLDPYRYGLWPACLLGVESTLHSHTPTRPM